MINDGFSLVLVTDFSSYKCNSTSYTLNFCQQSITENACRGCLVNETKLPICQRRLYAPMASCSDPQSWRFSFNLKVWPDGNIPGREIISSVRTKTLDETAHRAHTLIILSDPPTRWPTTMEILFLSEKSQGRRKRDVSGINASGWDTESNLIALFKLIN